MIDGVSMSDMSVWSGRLEKVGSYFYSLIFDSDPTSFSRPTAQTLLHLARVPGVKTKRD